MKTKLTLLAFMLGILTFVGCSSDDDNNDVTPPVTEDVTYEVTYYVTSVSEDYKLLGSYNLISYYDENGKEQGDFYELSELPFSVTMKDLKSSDELYFDITLSEKGDLKEDDLTKDSYSLSMVAGYSVKGSDGYSRSGEIGFNQTASKSKAIAYMDAIIAKEYGLAKQTIKDFRDKVIL